MGDLVMAEGKAETLETDKKDNKADKASTDLSANTWADIERLSSRPEPVKDTRAAQILPDLTIDRASTFKAVAPSSDRSPAQTELRPDAAPVRPEANKITAPANKLSSESLISAASDLKKNLNDKDSVDAILRSIPPAEKENFEKLYEQINSSKLRDELKTRRMDSSIALLEPKEEQRNAAWLQDNLNALAKLPPYDSPARQLTERSIRSNLRSMSDDERKALDQELLAKTGKDLSATIESSKLSDTSKKIADIYIKKGSAISADDLVDIAKLGLSGSRLSTASRLNIVKEAFAGDTDEAVKAREKFAGKNGEGKAELAKVFSSKDLKQAEDYMSIGKLHTATFIDMQASNWGSSDPKAINLVLDLMSKDERSKFSDGEKLALTGKTNGLNEKENESLNYYNKVHEALKNAASSFTSPSRWSSANTRKQVAIWEDLAAHGEETLIGRMAKAGNDFFDNYENDISAPVRAFTPKDWELMKDPSYRSKVFDLVGGTDGKSNNSIFDRNSAEAARKELLKTFGQTTPETAKEATHSTLADASSDFNAAISASRSQGLNPHAMMYDALMHGKSSEYQQLSQEQRDLLDTRLKYFPEGQRESAMKMLADLKAGKDVQPGIVEQLNFDALSGANKQTVIEHLVAAKDQLSNDPRLEAAARAAFGSSYQFEKFGKPIIDQKGISPEQLKELNWQIVAPFSDAYDAPDPSHVKLQPYLNGLKLLASTDKEKILSAAEKSTKDDPQAKDYLDKVFKGLSKEERELAINVLKSPNQEPGLSEQIRARALGADIQQDELIDKFRKLNPDEKINLINDFAQKYKSYLPTVLSEGADESTKKLVDLSLPMDSKDLFRASQDWARDSGTGLYGNVASTEIALAQTQEQLRASLLFKLPPEQREKARVEIEESFQKYVNALRTNDQAKDQYAKDVADKIMTVALTVAAPGIGASLSKLALTAGAAIAARSGVEGTIKGGLSGSDFAKASLFGVIDAASLGRFEAIQRAFGKALESSAAAELKTALKKDIAAGFEEYTGKDGQKKLAEKLGEQKIANPEQKAKDILDEYKRNLEMLGPSLSAEAGTQQLTPRFKDVVSVKVGDKEVQGTIVAFRRETDRQGKERVVAILKLAEDAKKAPIEKGPIELADLSEISQTVRNNGKVSESKFGYLSDTGDVFRSNGTAKPIFVKDHIAVEVSADNIKVISRPTPLAETIKESAASIKAATANGDILPNLAKAPELTWTGAPINPAEMAPVFNPLRGVEDGTRQSNCTANVGALLRSMRSKHLFTSKDVEELKSADGKSLLPGDVPGDRLGTPTPGRFVPPRDTAEDQIIPDFRDRAYKYIEAAGGVKIDRQEITNMAELKEGVDYIAVVPIENNEKSYVEHVMYARRIGPNDVLIYDPQSGVRWSANSFAGSGLRFHAVNTDLAPRFKPEQ